MVNCCVWGCKSRSERKEPGVTFHRFPANEKRKRHWIKSTAIDHNPGQNERVCSLHFDRKFFYHTHTSKARLMDGAVPTIFPGLELSSQLEQKFEKEVLKLELDSSTSITRTPSPTTTELSYSTATKSSPDTPREAKLKKKLYQLHTLNKQNARKIKLLQQTVRRYKKRITSLKSSIKTLKSKNYPQTSSNNEYPFEVILLPLS
ncbi:hypothetical protein ILUMI_00442 [Ignelater luminosus]|uniref:THAP-type domain-containing protein n=1 Tax=Ignelater luminosus TaxID=2038154 RepID=A0A8K0GMM5_IGNLU|nr:hypothetical protein ILUMI_00442 [Ignelater luminosus]